MSTDGRYFLYYDIFDNYNNPAHLNLDIEYLKNEHGGEPKKVDNDCVFYDKPKYTLTEDDFIKMHAYQAFESRDGAEFYEVYTKVPEITPIKSVQSIIDEYIPTKDENLKPYVVLVSGIGFGSLSMKHRLILETPGQDCTLQCNLLGESNDNYEPFTAINLDLFYLESLRKFIDIALTVIKKEAK